MKKVVMDQRRMQNGDLLTYYLLSNGSYHGAEISLTEKGTETARAATPFCLCREAAIRLLTAFAENDVYPIHLPDILRDFDFDSLT